MCGIFGYHHPEGLTQERVMQCLDALQRIRHRGPDGEGVVLISTRTGRAASLRTQDTPADVACDHEALPADLHEFDLLLGHRRLSIIEVSSAGHQPMRGPDGSLLIFNGEIYNYIELREELKKEGEAFHTASDSEVLMAAWRRWGGEGLNRLNGMWALALWDARHRKLLLTSDRFGVKPLYLTAVGDATAFCSEPKAFLALQGWNRTPHEAAVSHFLQTGITEVEGRTLFQSVRRFPPAHWAFFQPGGQPLEQVQPYWRPRQATTTLSYADACEQFREIFTSAVRLRMRADVDWGTSLSGGLDSSAIVYVASDLTRKVLKTGQGVMSFSAVFRGREGDESPYVDRIVKELGLQAHYVHPLEEFSPEEFSHLIYHQDFPVDSTSYFAERCVMRSASQAGVKVVLDGQGSDELFAGYHHHFYKYLRQLWLEGKWGRYRAEAQAFANLKGLDLAKVKANVRADIKGWLRRGWRQPQSIQEVWHYAKDTNEVLHADFDALMLPLYLRTEDRSSMMVSVETRQPFLDYRLVEFARSLPLTFKMRQGWQKAIVRDALPLMPDDIRFRKDKKGYTTPEADWLRQHSDFFVELATAAGASGFGMQRNSEAWHKEIVEGRTLNAVKHASLGLWLRHFA